MDWKKVNSNPICTLNCDNSILGGITRHLGTHELLPEHGASAKNLSVRKIRRCLLDSRNFYQPLENHEDCNPVFKLKEEADRILNRTQGLTFMHLSFEVAVRASKRVTLRVPLDLLRVYVT